VLTGESLNCNTATAGNKAELFILNAIDQNI
jgi:hypothetical protein